MEHEALLSYLQTQLVQASKRLSGLAHDIEGKLLFKRNIFLTLQQYATTFLEKRRDPRIIVMPGLRGTGKTTLLAQLFLSLPNENLTKIYLSVEEAIKRFDVTLWNIIETYEVLLDKHLEELNTPLFLFFDEIHYDPKWAFFLKTIYDRSPKIMVFCTGSAALLLREQVNADVARRVFFVDIHPIFFSEYLLFTYKKSILPEIQQNVKNAMLFSESGKDLFERLRDEEKKIKKYWLDIDTFEIPRYLKFGTFPFLLKSENEVLSVSFIAQIISKVIYTDIPQFYTFEIETLNRIDKILYLISDTLGVSATKLAQTVEMKLDTLRLVLKSLETSGLLIRIPPYGAHFKQVKKPSKYLFATPALRFSYLSSRESIRVFDVYQGSLREDTVGMYLHGILPPFSPFSLTYDVTAGGADFVVSLANQNIVIEVGTGKKDYRQIIQTAEKIKPKYSVILSNDKLEYSKEYNAVKMPLKYFLLL